MGDGNDSAIPSDIVKIIFLLGSFLGEKLEVITFLRELMFPSKYSFLKSIILTVLRISSISFFENKQPFPE